MFSLTEKIRSSKVEVKQMVDIPIGHNKVATFCTFENIADGKEHIALLFKGTTLSSKRPLVRIHSECLTGDVFKSGRCDCGEQLEEAIDKISEEGGLLIYLRQEGRGIGLYNKLAAYALQLKGLDTYEANRKLGLPDDLRDYKIAAQMLQALNATSIRLLSNNPDKKSQLEQHGIQVQELCSTGVFLKEENKSYLRAKVDKTGHFIKILA